MPKEIKFSSLATAATKEQLAHPKFLECLETWRKYARSITIIIPKSVTVPEGDSYAHVKFLKSADDRLLLLDVINHGLNARAGAPEDMVVIDPLVMLGRKTLEIYDIANRRHLGKAWMATGQALKPQGEGWEFEFNVLRFFFAPANIWNHVLAALKLANQVPFVQPIWGGWVAGYAQAGSPRVDRHRFHDISDLDCVAYLGNDDLVSDTTGYDLLVFNTPTTNYVKRTES